MWVGGLGGRLFDSEATKMLVTSKKRDEGSNSNESLTLVFDSFNDKENALVFSTTPSGLRNDLTVLNDAISSNQETFHSMIVGILSGMLKPQKILMAGT